jgi:hypothetical protein
VGWSSRVWDRASGIRCLIRAFSRILEHSTAYRTEFFRSLLELELELCLKLNRSDGVISPDADRGHKKIRKAFDLPVSHWL